VARYSESTTTATKRICSPSICCSSTTLPSHQRDAALTQVGDNLFQLLIGGGAEHPFAIQFEDLNMPRRVLPGTLRKTDP